MMPVLSRQGSEPTGPLDFDIRAQDSAIAGQENRRSPAGILRLNRSTGSDLPRSFLVAIMAS